MHMLYYVLSNQLL